jgi:hypothetical protein
MSHSTSAMSLRSQAGSRLTPQEKHKKISIGLGKEGSDIELEIIEKHGRLHSAGRFVIQENKQ